MVHQKRVMYDNQLIHNDIGRDLDRQGFYLENNIDRNREMRAEADQSSESIKLIRQAIFKRKFMFYSLIVLSLLAVGFVVLKKIGLV